MPKFLMKRWHGYHVVSLFTVAVLFIGILTYYQWQLGIIGFFMLGVLLIYTIQARISFEKQLEEYISTLSYRINKAGEEAVINLPVGILLYNEERVVQWVNPYINQVFGDTFIGKPLEDLSEHLLSIIEEEQEEGLISLKEHFFHVEYKKDERLLYFFDVTETVQTKEMYEEDQTVIGLIYLDNYDEVTQGMDDQVRSKLSSQVTATLNKWASDYEILLRRTGSDRFLAIFNKQTLSLIEKTKFGILDEIREVTGKEKIPITLSVGIGSGDGTIRELGALAQSSLDLALGRGGDQVAIKEKNGKVHFYGGKSNAMEKRTRVRARVISHALRDFVVESSKVIIMGHKNPDMDAIGAAIGVLKIAEVNGKDGYVVLDRDEIHSDVQKLMEEIEKHDHLWSHFITPEEAVEMANDQTLLVVVDTHRPSLVIEPKLLDRVDRVIVLDHHRRGEEFVTDPVLVYMEPYASSTAELVTELLEYQPKKLKMDILEATALLAGIIVDTKSFAVRTGSRTFDAASFLRRNGADTVLVQRLLKEDMDQYVRRAKLIESAIIYQDTIAIAKAAEDEVYSQVLIAQAADTLLTMDGITAAFVISRRQDGRIGISARSLGEINVQVIMEQLKGGGHLTNAATQLDDTSLDEAEDLLRDVIDEYLKGGS
ncbi:DHH family phosphoesterase [Alkalihalobacterium chitinilyticum]|uniref:Cyclic-di-AMP phosphodiesterase n=1 Tax=Alkalihalobacterium chitinilyticum TaxID=2980103 RepID=A0ABT5VFA7_9BACI|nr:DHH family phosphoesterase [Alkalihalobacterium chitinilyticum]MDE5414142.1 DHH family phosphoesterase [Alkalihalobacterium chitinilyticum]